MSDAFPFNDIEKYWQERWAEAEIFNCSDDTDREKFYCLEMFPYPSGKLHMGHVRNYSIGDAIARYRLMNGDNVLHPMGWDAFGLPAENAAIERNIHPNEWTMSNIDNMREHFKRLGFSIDWNREVATCHPGYYKWCQWIFLKMMEKGLVYRKKSSVNWCDTCRTILANEQVENNQCWRCHSEVVLRDIEGWFLKITDYAQELLDDLELLRGKWPERVITMQKNWIGRSEGAFVDFPIADGTGTIRVFTTRPDTLYGATFMVLAPENPLTLSLTKDPDRREEMLQFIAKVRRMDVNDRTSAEIPKTGVFTGAYAINPLTEEKIPIWAGDFVLIEYGTGAIMSVPAHDQRDFEFARKYGLPIRVVISAEGEEIDESLMEHAFEASGKMVHSGPFNGVDSRDGVLKVTQYLESRGIGEGAVTYRLRDWGISRQRYWGTPIPVIYCEQCGIVPVPETDLPVELPLDIHFDWDKGGNPLSRWDDFVNTTCPKCGKPARRETDTMDTFVDSSWYFARYTSAREDSQALDPAKVNYWLPVDQYIGGIEHAVMHLLYARFFTKVLRDIGLTTVSEPFDRLLTQGMVCLEVFSCPIHGFLYPEQVVESDTGTLTCKLCGTGIDIGRSEKMSKSKRNTKNPEEYLQRYGADTIRVFSLFAAPPEKDLDWSDSGVEGVFRFIKRLRRFAVEHADIIKGCSERKLEFPTPVSAEVEDIRRMSHDTVRRVTKDFQGRYHFNTSISLCMELINRIMAVADSDSDMSREMESAVTEAFQFLVALMNPFAPHLMEELWKYMGHEQMLAKGPWPEFDPKVAAKKTVVIPVQVNGKVRSRFEVAVGTAREILEEMVYSDAKLAGWLKDKTVRKIVVIPDRLVNVVVN